MAEQRKRRLGALVRRVAVLSAITALGLAVAPAAADAATTRSESSSGWGTDWNAATINAESNAFWKLHDAARALGETCTGVTYSNVGLIYIVPGGGGYVFSATATGTCG
jgi:hypothetical protein